MVDQKRQYAVQPKVLLAGLGGEEELQQQMNNLDAMDFFDRTATVARFSHDYLLQKISDACAELYRSNVCFAQRFQMTGKQWMDFMQECASSEFIGGSAETINWVCLEKWIGQFSVLAESKS